MDLKQDIRNILILSLIFILILFINWGHWADVIMDCGREVYTPELMAEGKLLYRDIFGMYSPLSYQINTLFYMIFGHNINVFAFLGIINSFIIYATLYAISRLFLNKFYSFSVIFFIITGLICRFNWCINFIIPYSYAVVYAISSALLALFFGLLFIKREKQEYLIFSFLFMGFSFANKPDLIMCIIPLYGLLFYKSRNIKNIILCTSAFLLPILISWGIQFIQGFTIADFKSYIDFLQSFFATDEQKFHDKGTSPIPNLTIISSLILEFIICGFIVCTSALSLKIMKEGKYKILGFLILLAMLPCIYYACERMTIGYMSAFEWVSIAAIVILILSVKEKNLIFIFFSTFTLLTCARYYFMQLNTFFTLLPIVFFASYFLPKANKLDNLKKYMTVSLMIMGVFNCTIHTLLKHTVDIPINTNGYGSLKIQRDKAYPFNAAVNWILKNTKETDTVLMLPEGPMINFITKRPSLPLYYHLIPNHISALGEENIVKSLNENKPDYILINNTSYYDYNKPYFCKDFAFEICEFIKNNYEQAESYSTVNTGNNEFHIDIYTLKNGKENEK